MREEVAPGRSDADGHQQGPVVPRHGQDGHAASRYRSARASCGEPTALTCPACGDARGGGGVGPRRVGREGEGEEGLEGGGVCTRRITGGGGEHRGEVEGDGVCFPFFTVRREASRGDERQQTWLRCSDRWSQY